MVNFPGDQSGHYKEKPLYGQASSKLLLQYSAVVFIAQFLLYSALAVAACCMKHGQMCVISTRSTPGMESNRQRSTALCHVHVRIAEHKECLQATHDAIAFIFLTS